MKTMKGLLVSVLVLLVVSSLAQAAGQVQVNQSTTVSVEVRNKARYDVNVAVKLSGFDNAGNSVGNLCREVRLGKKSLTRVSYAWKAPAYATGLYWSPRLEVGGRCPGGISDDDDDDEHHH